VKLDDPTALYDEAGGMLGSFDEAVLVAVHQRWM
jgi:hypothetical protein